MAEIRDEELLFELAHFRSQGYAPYLVAFYNGRGEFRVTSTLDPGHHVVAFLKDLIERIEDAYVCQRDTAH